MAESRWVTIIIASLLWSILLVRGVSCLFIIILFLYIDAFNSFIYLLFCLSIFLGQVNVMFESVVVVNETIGSFNICLNFSETLTNDTIINISVDNSSQARNGTGKY